MNILRYTCLVLILIGAINWGLVGAFDFNLVDIIFGNMSIIARIIYILVGLSGLAFIFMINPEYRD